jgi:hypothetical protein
MNVGNWPLTRSGLDRLSVCRCQTPGQAFRMVGRLLPDLDTDAAVCSL